MEYNTKKAIEAQKEYCQRKGYPNFAPAYDGTCFRCNHDIYSEVKHSDGRVTGISVEYAASHLITGCPHCNYSFVD